MSNEVNEFPNEAFFVIWNVNMARDSIVETPLRFRINLERRRNNVDAVHELYSACIAKGKNKATKTALSIK